MTIERGRDKGTSGEQENISLDFAQIPKSRRPLVWRKTQLWMARYPSPGVARYSETMNS